ncbi:twin-arginine translocase TatA/TatE family subunit [Roseicyclus sp. F158]|uniref:Sec-independent protein translocase protein TatA n=1 Tax=Tropicimonas omnivorans TaxID=3075590 RepID=A0ABU3DG71_9RHOB|nr:twin-arginine translocase TatA/TatE family subunit [Roseicyclus sp. F158]MDT0682716.1 twin-arginine translocase TatA/TatE family subunit [Roseicyclus sp. F158]
MFNNIGIPGLILIAVVVLVLFGRGKVSALMGEVGKGITAFKKGVSEGSTEDDEETRTAEQTRIESPAATTHDATPAPETLRERDKV